VNKQLLLAVATGALALSGCAVSPEEDPVNIRMNDLDARVQRIERVLTNQSLLELAQRIDALQADLRTMRGEVELLQNQNEGGKTQTRNLYSDLERRLAALETLGGVGAPAQGSAPPLPASGASEQATYDAAMAALRTGNYDKAAASFGEVVTNYPNGDLASNAQFWIGESLLHQRRSGERHHGLSQGAQRLARVTQGAGCDGEARVLAVGLEANRRGAHDIARGGAKISGLRPRRSSPRIGSSVLPGNNR
jgi:TolA-binding protein